MIKYILSVANEIIDGKLGYQDFMRKLTDLEDYSNEEKQSIKFLVNGLLNRYYRYFYSITANEETDLSKEDVLAVALYSYIVEKNINAISYEDILKTLPVQKQVSLEEKFPNSSFPIRIPSSFHVENPALAYASRFSLPLFLIEQLLKDVGNKNIVQFLAKKPLDNYGLINEAKVSSSDFLTKHPQFVGGTSQNEFIYKGKDYIKKTKAYTDNEIIIAPRSYFEIARLIESLTPASVLFMQFEDTSLLLLLALKFPTLPIHYWAKESKSKYILQHLIRKFNLANVTFVTNIVATYDLVVTTLSSSKINGNIRHRDFYFRLNPLLEDYASRAGVELNSVKDYVNESGKLIFLTATALRAETHYQALSFIRDDPEFILKREKQYFHFHEQQETIYFALLSKGEDANES